MNHTSRSPYENDAENGATTAGPVELWHQTFHELLDGIARSTDPFGMTAPIVHAQLAWAAHPKELSDRLVSLSSDLWRLQQHTLNRLFGLPDTDPIPVTEGDARFADPAWTDLPTFDLMKEWYLAFTRHTQDMLYDTPGIVLPNQLTTRLTTSELAQVVPKKRAQHVTLRVREGKSVLLGGVAQLHMRSGKPFLFTFYLANAVKIHPTDTAKVEEVLRKHAGGMLAPPDSYVHAPALYL